MTTDSLVAGSARDPARPYARSWLDAFFGRMSALPGPTWLAYVVLALGSILLANSALWLSGLRPWGDFSPVQIFWGISGALIIAASHHLRNVAGDAFDRFRPALGTGVDDPERWRYELTVMPALPIVVITVLMLALTPAYYVFDPVASQVVGLSPVGLVARGLSEGATSVAFVAIAFQGIRQLRRVTALHRLANAVDPFRAAPLYAFSRLTAQIGVIMLLFISAGLLANPDALTSSTTAILWLPWLVGTPIVAIVVFLVPLLGMHARLDAERERQASAADSRLKLLVSELNEAIDARATDRVDALDRTIAALRREREVIARLPTWPWSTGTIRGFGSALLLPILLFLIQRYLGTIFGG